MENTISFAEAVARATAADPRYQPGAYEFVRDALHVAAKKFREGSEDSHVTGQELLEGFRLHALNEFGPMALFILHQWGIRGGEDVGNIVYNLIDTEYFGKNEGDSLDDFKGGYDFHEAFYEPFLPSSARNKADQRQP